MINFNAPYHRPTFLTFLEDRFLPDDFVILEEEYEDLNFATRYTVDATKLGTCRSMELDVYEITHTSSHDARVGIAQDAFRLMLHKSYNNRALVIFKQENNPQYRFSLLQIEAEQADNSARITRSFSNPRRYSFLLGENAHIKTPTQFLLEKGELTLKDGSYFNDLQERFSVEVLTKLFYRELSDWYFWALKQVEFPSKPTVEKAHAEGKSLDDLRKEHNATNVIRLLTRILFVWFIKQKGLIPEELFDENELKNNILTELNPIKQTGLFSETGKESVYYKAILQNLFFASLNCPIKPQSDDEDKRERGFRRDANYGDDFGNDWLFRYRKYFKNPDAFVELINSKVPFLNGGLFECLDDKQNKIYIDGFSDNMAKGERLTVPDYIFFGRDENVDLSDDYGEDTPQAKQASVKGLINILKTYNFTVEENTPAEVEVALDPELLGKVFENLLASFNPETKTTARKQTGSFYTPREIVNYMVDESLFAYFKGKTTIDEEKIRPLFLYTDEMPDLTETQTDELVNALYECKILDPACGSGAFPMGILQKLVHVLQKADPENRHWKKVQHEKAQLEIQQALDIEDKKDRENRLIEINNAFDITKNTPDYARKLFLIENCIYGVDIQPIATQISKLRFFISLVVDQNNNANEDNFGIIPLPNLETKFVTANTLIGIERPTGQLSLSNTDEIKKLQEELRVCRHKIFSARTKKTKKKYRLLDQEKRLAIANELKNNGWNNSDADKLAGWNPYNQNASSPFFDPEWMFGLQKENQQLNSAGQSGYFDIVLGNPPYVDAENMVISDLKNREIYNRLFDTTVGNWDLFVPFIEKGISLGNIISFIVPNKLISQDYAETIRQLMLSQKILEIRDYSRQNVFPIADVYPITFIVQKPDNNLSELKITEMRSINSVNRTNVIDVSLLNQYPWDIFFFGENLSSILIRLLNEENKISKLVNFVSPCTVSEAYLIKEQLVDINETNGYKKLINSGTIDKYTSFWGIKKTSYIKGQYNYPVIRNEHLQSINQNRFDQSNQSKIIIANMTQDLEAFIDVNSEYLAGKSTVIGLGSLENLLFITGLINSSLISKLYKTAHHSTKMKGNALSVTANRINELPYIENDYYINAIKDDVSKILDNINKRLDFQSLVKHIDFLVYKLYNLTFDEVKIIDPEIENIISREDFEAENFGL